MCVCVHQSTQTCVMLNLYMACVCVWGGCIHVYTDLGHPEACADALGERLDQDPLEEAHQLHRACAAPAETRPSRVHNNVTRELGTSLWHLGPDRHVLQDARLAPQLPPELSWGQVTSGTATPPIDVNSPAASVDPPPPKKKMSAHPRVSSPLCPLNHRCCATCCACRRGAGCRRIRAAGRRRTGPSRRGSP